MTAWLASILGVVVVGVVVELLTQNRRMGGFVRSIYGFIVLLVIVSPLPNLIKADWWTSGADDLINTELADHLAQGSRQMQIRQILLAMGYEDALITPVDDVIYVNLGVVVDAETLAELQKALGEGVVIL